MLYGDVKRCIPLNSCYVMCGYFYRIIFAVSTKGEDKLEENGNNMYTTKAQIWNMMMINRILRWCKAMMMGMSDDM